MTTTNKKFQQLKCSAIYAINSYNRDSLFQVYGRCQAYYEMNAITWEQFSELNEMIVRNAINNPAWFRKVG